MIRLVTTVMICFTLGYPSEQSDLFALYRAGSFSKACDLGARLLGKYKKEEQFISAYAFSCLNADMIDRLALPIILLNNSAEARKNAAYFSAILLQKNLLISALENDENLEGIRLPTTEYVLSKVFELYVRGNFKKNNHTYVLQDPENPRHVYRLLFVPSDRTPKIIINEYYDTILTKQHTYL